MQKIEASKSMQGERELESGVEPEVLLDDLPQTEESGMVELESGKVKLGFRLSSPGFSKRVWTRIRPYFIILLLFEFLLIIFGEVDIVWGLDKDVLSIVSLVLSVVFFVGLFFKGIYFKNFKRAIFDPIVLASLLGTSSGLMKVFIYFELWTIPNLLLEVVMLVGLAIMTVILMFLVYFPGLFLFKKVSNIRKYYENKIPKEL